MASARATTMSMVLSLVLVVTGLGQGSPALAQQDLQGGIQSLVDQMITSMEQQQKRKLALLDFTKLDGSVDNFGRYVSEQLITQMFLTRKFEVIERRQLDKILSELKLNLSDLINPENAKRLGKIYGVDAIATGSVTELAATLAVNSRLIETETGRVFAVASARFAKDPDVLSLIGTQVLSPPTGDSRSGSKAGRIEAEGFVFEPRACRRTARTNVVCTVSFTNADNEERELEIFNSWAGFKGRTQLVDNGGNEYFARIMIGSTSTGNLDPLNPSIPTHPTSLSRKFVPRVPVNVGFVAEGVREDATHMTVVIGIRTFKKSAVVRDIPILKSGSMLPQTPPSISAPPPPERKAIALDDLIQDDPEARSFTRAERVIQRDYESVWSAVITQLAEHGGDVVSSDHDQGYIVTNLKERRKLLAHFKVKYFVVMERLSPGTSRVQTLGVRYLYNIVFRRWERWDEPELLLKFVEAGLR